MKLTFASQYTRKIAYEEYPLEVYCHGHFEIKSCDYYEQEDCPKSCSFAKVKESTPRCEEEDSSSKSSHSFSSPHSNFRNGLERFLKNGKNKKSKAP